MYPGMNGYSGTFKEHPGTAPVLPGRVHRGSSRLLKPSKSEIFLSAVIDGYPTSVVRFLNTSPVKDTAGRGIVADVRVAAAVSLTGISLERRSSPLTVPFVCSFKWAARGKGFAHEHDPTMEPKILCVPGFEPGLIPRLTTRLRDRRGALKT